MPSKPSEEKSVWVYIKLEGEGFADSDEFDIRYALEDALEDRGIGKLEGAGSGGGWMDISFGVEHLAATYLALVALTNLLVEYNVPDKLVRFKVVRKDEEFCDNLPEFQLGDCLSYRFEDGDFGAAIILKFSHAGSRSSTEQGMQTGMPPIASEAVKVLLGILDYKNGYPPEPLVFDQRN